MNRQSKKYKEDNNKRAKEYYAKNKEEVSKKAKERYRKSPEEAKKRAMKWYLANKERHKELCKRWMKNHPIEKQVIVKRWEKKNPQRAYKMHYKATNNWLEKNLGMRNYYNRKRRGLKHGADGNFTPEEWGDLKQKYNYTCLCCERKEPEIKLVSDHIIPLSKGGDNNIQNIQPLCGRCNSVKWNKIVSLKQLRDLIKIDTMGKIEDRKKYTLPNREYLKKKWGY